MYMTLADLQAKFADENSKDFALNFIHDAHEVHVDSVEFRKQDSAGNYLEDIDVDVMRQDLNLLNEYVQVVQAILDNRQSMAYSRLGLYIQAPFYEKYFEVDPNKRTISIPDGFKANGVAVNGDHLAEILWFHMPRFFDVTDLYNCALPGGSLRIIWRNTASASKEATPAVPVAIMPFGDDLYFGWYLTEDATFAAGNIEFALEFIINRPGAEAGTTAEPGFRLYTQPATVAVKTGLNLDNISTELEDVSDKLYDRAVYSGVINTITAAAPVITKNLPTDAGLDENNNPIPLDLIHMEELESRPEGDYFVFEINAKVPDEKTAENPNGQNNLLYKWVWNGAVLDDAHIAEAINNPAMLPGAETYVLASEKYVEPSDPAADGLTYKTLTTNVPGTYQVYVGNRTVTNSGIHYVQSKQAYLAPAYDIRVDSSTLPHYVFLDGKDVDERPASAVLHAIAKDLKTDGEPNGEVTYQWYRGTTADLENATIAPGAGADTNTYDPLNGTTTVNNNAARGYYFMKATNTKNNTITVAYSQNVWVESVPAPIATGLMSLTKDANDSKVWVLNVGSAYSYEGQTFEYMVRIHAHIANQNGVYEDKFIDVDLDSVHNNGNKFNTQSVTFSLEDITYTQVPQNTMYDLEVFVVPYVVPVGTTAPRYATTVASTGVITKAYTEIQAVQQVFD